MLAKLIYMDISVYLVFFVRYSVFLRFGVIPTTNGHQYKILRLVTIQRSIQFTQTSHLSSQCPSSEYHITTWPLYVMVWAIAGDKQLLTEKCRTLIVHRDDGGYGLSLSGDKPTRIQTVKVRIWDHYFLLTDHKWWHATRHLTLERYFLAHNTQKLTAN